MNKTSSRESKQFSRRAFVLGLCSTALYGGLISRMGWLQIVNGKQYQTLSDNNRIHVNLVTPVRGYILDRNGHMLAYNEQNFRVQIVPEQTKDIDLLVLGHRRMSTFKSNLMDSVDEGIVNHAKCPVLVVPK